MERISSDTAFVEILKVLEQRSTCLRRRVAAVIVKDGMILSTGYNGSPHKLEHCRTCLRIEMKIPSGERMEICRAVHAEQNALIQCALKQTDPSGATLYCSNSPCVTCAKMIIQSRIKEIHYLEEYKDALSIQMLEDAEIKLYKIGG
jgi:dCMP deaminase